MRAKCIQDCIDGPTAWQYKTDGGEKKDGYYDGIEPDSPLARYFEFPDEKVNARVAESAAQHDAEVAKKLAKAQAEKRRR